MSARQFQVAIEDADGNKLGAGPIVTAQNWRMTQRLSKAGEFSFTMPAGDPKAALFYPKGSIRAAHASAMIAGAIVDLGAGRIDKIDAFKDSNGAWMLTVAGDDRLRELTDLDVGDLEIWDDQVQIPGDVRFLSNAGVDSELPNTFDDNTGTYDTLLLNDAGTPPDYLYIYCDTSFRSVTFTLGSQINTTGSSGLNAQYFGMTSGWTSLSIADGTWVGGRTLHQSGTISWTRPADETIVTHSGKTGHWVRFYPTVGLTNVDIQEITVTAKGPKAADIAPVLALAPAGWTQNTSSPYYASTANGTYAKFSGETVLNALVKIAKASGEQFILSGSRSIGWLRGDTPSSGIRALYGAVDPVAVAGNPKVCIITDIQETTDSYEYGITRVKPFGAGAGSSRLTLAKTTRTAPAGYVLDAANNLLRVDPEPSPIRSRRMSFSQVGGVDNPLGDAAAADELFDAALAWLEWHKDPYVSYRLGVDQCNVQLLPGQTIHVIAQKWIDGFHAIDIDRDLVILEVQSALDTSGMRPVSLTVATTDRWPESDADALAAVLEEGEVRASRDFAVPYAATGLALPATG